MPYVNVYVDPSDVLAEVPDERLEEEFARRKKPVATDKEAEVIAIEVEDLRLVSDRLARGQVEDALLLLERLLPAELSFLSHDVARFYGARPS